MSEAAPGRATRGADAAILAELVGALFETHAQFAPAGWTRPPGHEPDLEDLGRRIDEGRGRVIEREGRSVGHVLWTAASRSRLEDPDPSLAYLWQLFVDVPLQGTGLARELHAWALADAAEQGYARMRLLAVTLNARARRFYEREAWTLVGDHGWDEGLDLALVMYERRLGEAAAPDSRD